MSFWGVARRGFRMCDATTIPIAFTMETPNNKRRER